LLAVLALGAAVLPSTGWTCALAIVLGLAGVVLLHGNGWRSGALVFAAIATSIGLLDLFAGLLSPQAHGAGLVESFEPYDWKIEDADLGYRPRPGSRVVATSTYDGKTVFRATYTIRPDGTRATPAAPAGADTYLFLGDSFMFGQGLSDDQTLPAQFAGDNGFTPRTVLFAAPGDAPNQFVRAVESGRFGALGKQKLKAVVTWIIPAHLARVTGDEPWLGPSPRYVLEDGAPRFTGSFEEHRWHDPIDGLRYLADAHFAFVAALGQRQRQERQAALFSALVLRLQELVREKLGAPLLVIYSWPDKDSPSGAGGRGGAQPALVAILEGLRARGVPLLGVDRLTYGIPVEKIMFPHDGHPTAFTDGLIAAELKRRLIGP